MLPIVAGRPTTDTGTVTGRFQHDEAYGRCLWTLAIRQERGVGRGGRAARWTGRYVDALRGLQLCRLVWPRSLPRMMAWRWPAGRVPALRRESASVVRGKAAATLSAAIRSDGGAAAVQTCPAQSHDARSSVLTRRQWHCEHCRRQSSYVYNCPVRVTGADLSGINSTPMYGSMVCGEQHSLTTDVMAGDSFRAATPRVNGPPQLRGAARARAVRPSSQARTGMSRSGE